MPIAGLLREFRPWRGAGTGSSLELRHHRFVFSNLRSFPGCLMKKVLNDVWYIRTPEGRELTAKTTRAVQHHIRNGAISPESRVRRSRNQEWTSLEWTAEFSDLVNGRERTKKETAPKRPGSSPEIILPAGLAARLDPMRLRTLGVRGLWEDLIGALDSTFTRKKLGLTLIVSALAGMVVALVFSLFSRVLNGGSGANVWPVAIGVMAVAAVPLFACLNGLLSRMVHVELSYMRPATWKEVWIGFGRSALRLIGAYLFILGGALLLMQGCRWAPGYLAELLQQRTGRPMLAESIGTALSAVGVLAEIALWFVVGLSWLLAPVIVVEDLGIFQGLRSWVVLLRQHLGRILLGQALALATGVVIALPFALPVWLALANYPIPGNVPADSLRGLIIGAAAAPILAFVAVANVFVYLDVKYEGEK